MPFTLVRMYQHFVRAFYFHLQG